MDELKRPLAAPAVVAVAAFLAAGAPAGSSLQGSSLRLVQLAPLKVRGQAFAPRERVKLLYSNEGRSLVRRVTTTRTGTFVVTFVEARPSRCDTFRIVAVRTAGGRVVLKHLPAPACLIE